MKILVAVALVIGLASLVSSVFYTISFTSMSNQIQTLNGTVNELRISLSSLQRDLSIVRESYYPMVIKDALGRVITIKSEPTRIVSGCPTMTETLFALGLSDKVVGADSYSDYPKEFIDLKQQGKIAVVGGVTTLDPERVAALRPDLVVIDASLQGKFIPALENLGLTVVALDAKSLDDVRGNIQLLAKVTFRLGEGSRLVDEIDAAVHDVSAKTSPANKTSVLLICWHDPMYAAGGGTYANELISIAGGANIVSNRTGWVVVSPEQVVAANPSVIIMTSMSLPLKPDELLSYFRSLPGFGNVDAIKNNRVYFLTGDASNALERAGPRIVDGLHLLGYILHPEVFKVQLPNVLSSNYTAYLGG